MNNNILIVDDEKLIRNLLSAALTEQGYHCYPVAGVEQAVTLLEHDSFAMIISDIMMPGKSGIELLKEVKRTYPDTIVIMITGLSDMETCLECIHQGADDYITKPFGVSRVTLTVRNLMQTRNLTLEKREYQHELERRVAEQTQQIRAAMNDLHCACDNTLSALVKALDAREKEVGSHSERVMNYAILIGTKLGLSGRDLEHLAKGALLHDIGKIGVSDTILLKEGPLNEQEWFEMRKHPQVGYEILAGVSFLKEPAEIIRTHHEKYDGTGYPSGCSGENIPLGSRIFAVIDTLDAMTSNRPYRKELPYQAVRDEVQRFSGSQFDPEIAALFLSLPRKELEECAGKMFLD